MTRAIVGSSGIEGSIEFGTVAWTLTVLALTIPAKIHAQRCRQVKAGMRQCLWLPKDSPPKCLPTAIRAEANRNKAMKLNDEIKPIDMNRIEIEARRMRAQAVADLARSFWTWVRGVAHVGMGRTA